MHNSTTPITVTVARMPWSSQSPTEQESAAGVTTRYDTTICGDAWRLLGWPEGNRITGLGEHGMWWTLARTGLDGSRHDHGVPATVLDAVRWATDVLQEAYSPDVQQANQRGEFCGLGADPRHRVSDCPGLHS